MFSYVFPLYFTKKTSAVLHTYFALAYSKPTRLVAIRARIIRASVYQHPVGTQGGSLVSEVLEWD